MEPFLALPRSLRWAVGIFAALAFAGILYYFVHPSPNDGYDFQAFYCGAKVLAAHANPYLDQPLHACEAQAAPRIAYTLGHITVPSPLPPYALAMFIPLSMLPYVWAKAIWLLVLLASVVLCAWAAAKLSRLPFVLAAAGCALAIGAPALPLGALAPVPIALIFLAAVFVSRDNWNAAAVCAALAMVEPNVALPVNIALFCFVPAMRVRLSAAALALAAIAIRLAGLPTTIFYFTSQLPHHAASEVNNVAQFSLTTLLYHFGASAQAAVRAGSIQYAVLVAGGIWLGAALAKRYANAAFLVAAPAACAIMGGTYIHLSEIAVATLLACMLAERIDDARAWIAVLLIAVPWETMIDWMLFLPFVPVCALLLVWSKWRSTPATLIACSVAFLSLAWRLHLAQVAAADHTMLLVPLIPAPPVGAGADVTWAMWNRFAPVLPFLWAEKALTVAGFGLLLATALKAASPAPARAIS